MNLFRNMLYMARRFKTATTLNFLGLVVAFAACYLFLTQVVYNHSYNKGLTASEQLYRVETPGLFDKGKWQTNVNRLIGGELERLPQVDGVALTRVDGKWKFMKGDSEMKLTTAKASDRALATLAPRLLDGTLVWSQTDREGIVIPASVAKKYFGTVECSGRCMFDGEDSVRVRGVYEDFPTNSSFGDNYVFANLGDESMEQMGIYGNWNYDCYVRLPQQVDEQAINETMNKAMLKKLHSLFVEYGHEDEWNPGHFESSLKLRLVPVSQTWFSGVGHDDKGNRAVDWILQLACLLVVVVAAINFLNFMLGESPMRIKSVNTRHVLGESVASLRLRLVAEAVVTSLLAFAVAVVVDHLLAEWPFLSELTMGSIALADHLPLLLALGVVAVVVGVVAGAYPAFYVTSFQPALALKGTFGLSPKGRQLRRGLLCLQFLVTSIMVVYIGILYLQSHYIYNSDYGFAKDEVMYANVWELMEKSDKREALRQELMALTGVKDVAYSKFVIGSGDEYMAWGRSDKLHEVQFTVIPVDCHYLRTMGIPIVEGRDFSETDGDCYIINQAARRQWDWVEMGKPLLDDDMPVVGVCSNVRFGSTRMDNNASPLAFIIFGKKMTEIGWSNDLNIVNVRIAAGIDKVQMRQSIKDVCTRMGMQQPPEVRFLDQKLEDTYQYEFRFIRQVMVFSVVCLVITLIGVFCMTMFETEYRRKEIGIRKVMGASTGQILLMICSHYALLLTASFVVAAPLAWYIGRQWLRGFVERTPIYWWLFPLALLLVGMVTMGTIVAQSWRAANENPINSIKTE